MEDLVSMIVNQQDLSARVEYIRELHKTLNFYKILIPYCMSIRVGNLTFFQWLIQNQFPKSMGQIICFVTFIFLKNGLFLASKESYSDYLISQFFIKYIESPELQNSKYIKLLIIYLLQISNFNSKATLQLSPQHQLSLKQYIEQHLQLTDPINYILLSEAIYLITKKQLIESLSKKYAVKNFD